MRRNMWYKDPSANIKLKFLNDDGKTDILSYTLEKGDKKGRYVFTIKSFKAYSEERPN
jgi:ssRNA-specific RNase YbeY (16S rRNA maturation enzyme)